jgi:membrane protein
LVGAGAVSWNRLRGQDLSIKSYSPSAYSHGIEMPFDRPAQPLPESDIPMTSRTLFEVIWNAICRARRDHITLIAAGVAFFMLLAIFPGLGAALSVYSLFADPGQGGPLLSALPGVLPEQVTQFIAAQIKQVAQRQQAAQSPFDPAAILGFGMLLWSSNRGMRSIFTALNTIGNKTEGRGIIKLTAISLLFTLGFLLFSVCAAGLILVLPSVLTAIGLDAVFVTTLRLLRWPVLLLVLGLSLAVIYRFGATQASDNWRDVAPGSVAAAFLWLISSIIFEWVFTTFGSFDRFYGSLSVVIGFMIWVWISVTALLFGAEINAAAYRNTSQRENNSADAN